MEPDGLKSILLSIQVLNGMKQIIGKFGTHSISIRLLRRAKYRRRVIGRHKPRGILRLKESAAMLGNAKLAAKHRLSGRRSQADDDLRLDNENLRMQPGLAGLNLSRGGFFVQS